MSGEREGTRWLRECLPLSRKFYSLRREIRRNGTSTKGTSWYGPPQQHGDADGGNIQAPTQGRKLTKLSMLLPQWANRSSKPPTPAQRAKDPEGPKKLSERVAKFTTLRNP